MSTSTSAGGKRPADDDEAFTDDVEELTDEADDADLDADDYDDLDDEPDEAPRGKAAKDAKAKDGKDSKDAKAKDAKADRKPVRKMAKPSARLRKPIAPVKVAKDRPWGLIAMFTAVGVLFVSIVGYTGWRAYTEGLPWDKKAERINGIVNYKKTQPKMFDGAAGGHVKGRLSYPVTPPVGGKHSFDWQNCMGDIYDGEIPSEHAVHSLEHGAVWITYRPDLPKDQVEKLKSKVRDKDHMMMSQYPDLDKPISIQAWGYQLKVDSAGDGRIDDFIKALRVNAGIEKNGSCTGGITKIGKEPFDG